MIPCMSNMEAELLEAITARNAIAVDLATDLLRLARARDGHDAWDVMFYTELAGGRLSSMAARIEALTAVIMQRSGVSWDAMAAPLEISKQAVHRRLANSGEELYQQAILEKPYRTTDEETLHEMLELLDGARSDEEFNDALETVDTTLGFETRGMLRRLYFIPSPADVLFAPHDLAQDLAELRHHPRWWWSEFET